VFGTPAFWNNTLYITALTAPLNAYAVSPSTGGFSGVTSQSSTIFRVMGMTPAVSARGAAANGIVWALDSQNFCTAQSNGCGPTVLHAYDATNLATELWNSAMTSGPDNAGFAVKFSVPTVANGRVYIGTRGNNNGGADSSSSVPGEVDVYGLKP
jgi:outer membrane protein assembly factor BamB